MLAPTHYFGDRKYSGPFLGQYYCPENGPEYFLEYLVLMIYSIFSRGLDIPQAVENKFQTKKGI